MGNCQAAEAATVVIEHPNGRVERFYWSVGASKVMADNPGNYVAAVISTTTTTTATGSCRTTNNRCNRVPAVVKHLKLLRPDDTLYIGHVYRLVSFEEVMKEFASKKANLERLLESNNGKKRVHGGRRQPESSSQSAPDSQQVVESASNNSSSRRSGLRHGQWKPALQSIAEIGS